MGAKADKLASEVQVIVHGIIDNDQVYQEKLSNEVMDSYNKRGISILIQRSVVDSISAGIVKDLYDESKFGKVFKPKLEEANKTIGLDEEHIPKVVTAGVQKYISGVRKKLLLSMVGGKNGEEKEKEIVQELQTAFDKMEPNFQFI